MKKTNKTLPVAVGGKGTAMPKAQLNAAGELLLYGEIDDWWDELDAPTITAELQKVAPQSGPFVVRIQSNGGSILAGFAIIDAMRSLGREIHAIVDGYALSMGAYIALSADKLSISENGWLMLHKARIDGFALTSADMKKEADFLDQLDVRLMQIVANKTGLDTETISQNLNDDFWISGADAVAQGYADELLQPIKAVANFDTNQLTVPSALKSLMTSNPAASTATNQPKRGNTMNWEARAKAVGINRRENEADADFQARIIAAEEAAAASTDPRPAAVSKDPAPTAAAAAAAAAAVAAERKRISEIRAICATHRMDETVTSELVSTGADLATARAKILEVVAHRTAQQMPAGHVSVNAREGMRTAMAAALEHRAGLTNELPDEARQFRNMDLMEMARASLESFGVSTHSRSRNEIAAQALNTGDFPILLGDVANRSLRAGYEASPRTFTPFTRRTSANDFRAMSRVQLGDAPALEKVAEGGEFRYGAMAESGESYKLETYGKIIPITRQAIINDDLGAFTRIPKAFGAAAADLEGDIVWGLITGNPKMSDGKNLFSADHSNLDNTGAAIGITGLAAMRAMLRTQKALSKDKNARALNLTPKFLIVPAALETIAQQYLAEISAVKGGEVNPFAGSMTLIVEPRLDAVSDQVWYVAADTSRIDTIEYAYLNGEDGVYIETQQGFDVDGVKIKARLDFGAGIVDYRGLAKNAGVNK